MNNYPTCCQSGDPGSIFTRAGFVIVLFCFAIFSPLPAGERPIQNIIPDAARPLPLAAVRLTGGPLKHAQDLNGKYLLDLEPDRLNDRVDGRTAETCNVYNMIKMARRLFALRLDEHYAAFHERTLFNHILASMDPEDGRTCYMVPVGRGVQHEYQNMSEDFTCCVGSGMESHALHGFGLYYVSGDRLWVNLRCPIKRAIISY